MSSVLRDRTLEGKVVTRHFAIAAVLTLVAGLGAPVYGQDKNLAQKSFAAPGVAVNALGAAYEKGDPKAVAEILGDDGFQLVSSGDAVTDRHEREWFLSLYREGHKVVPDGKNQAVLQLGKDRQPYPIPLVKEGGRWRFDKVEGHEDLLSRRMSKNELSALNFVVVLAEAQREYVKRGHSGGGAPEYARRLVSNPGRHDGLAWAGKNGKTEGPLAGLADAARDEGYQGAKKGEAQVYRGYCYQLLTAQGGNAPGGARDYLVNGRLTGGFALIAYPVRYGVSGIMTFLVNQDGIVYQKDLGPDTSAIAGKTTRFDPDASWTKGK
jgi:DUF2950 family protein